MKVYKEAKLLQMLVKAEYKYSNREVCIVKQLGKDYNTICQVTFFPLTIANTRTGKNRLSTRLSPPSSLSGSSAYSCSG
jgi:hypothetical protein